MTRYFLCTLPVAVVDGETVEKAKYSLKTSEKYNEHKLINMFQRTQ